MCLDNIFMVLLISELEKIGVKKPISLNFGSPWGDSGVPACVGIVCHHCIVYILNSRKKHNFLCL